MGEPMTSDAKGQSITFTLDGQEVEASPDETIFRVARRHDIKLPHLCYTPKPGYRPPNRDTKVLTGMRGKMWIDRQAFQWVRVHAEIFRPVTFGLFVAEALPGTEFTLEEAPVAANIWLPSHFTTTVKATVLHFWSKNSRDEEFYSDYRPAPELTASR